MLFGKSKRIRSRISTFLNPVLKQLTVPVKGDCAGWFVWRNLDCRYDIEMANVHYDYMNDFLDHLSTEGERVKKKVS